MNTTDALDGTHSSLTFLRCSADSIVDLTFAFETLRIKVGIRFSHL